MEQQQHVLVPGEVSVEYVQKAEVRLRDRSVAGISDISKVIYGACADAAHLASNKDTRKTPGRPSRRPDLSSPDGRAPFPGWQSSAEEHSKSGLLSEVTARPRARLCLVDRLGLTYDFSV
jgi:hypothetical protein